MESVDKLRGIICDVNVAELSANIQQPIGTGREARVSPAWVDSWQRAAERALDEIEQELADRYMELPLDADGVPIHVADWMRHCDLIVQCAAVSPERVYYWDECKDGHWVMGVKCRHAKPRTLEDVLREYGERVLNSGHQWGLDAQKVIIDYADEIRELLEVDK